MKGFFFALNAYGLAIHLLFSKKFSWFLIFPFLTLLLIFFVGKEFIVFLGDSIYNSFAVNLQAFISDIPGLGWLDDMVNWLVNVLVRITYYFLFVMYSGYLVMIIMSPIYSWLSERIEKELNGNVYQFHFFEFMHDILRGILISLRNMFYQTLFVILMFFLSFIPVVGLLAPIILLLVSAYYYGFSFMDYAIERKRLNVKASAKYVKNRSGCAIGIGIVFVCSLMIPVLNIFACSLISLLSVIAGTVVVEKDNDLKSGSYCIQ